MTVATLICMVVLRQCNDEWVISWKLCEGKAECVFSRNVCKVGVMDIILSVTLILNTYLHPCLPHHTYISGHYTACLHVFALHLMELPRWMESSVFIHLTQLPSNPTIFAFGQLALRCDFSKTKIQPLTLFLTPILILSINIQQ